MCTTVLAVLLAACAPEDETSTGATVSEMEPIVLSLSEFNPEKGIFGEAWLAFEEEVEERSDGKITFENYWASSLFSGPESLAGVGDSVADLGTIIPSYYPAELPVTSWLGGLGNAVSSSTAHAVAGGGAATYELALGNQAVTDEFAQHNLKVLTASASPPYNMLCTDQVDGVASADGKRARTSGAAWTASVEAVGITAVSLGIDELFESLQRGVIDCSVQNPTGWIDFGLPDIATEYVPITMAQMTPSAFVMNLDTWESLPVEAQQIIHDAMAGATRFLWNRYMEREAEFAEFVGDDGPIHVNDVSELEPLVEEQRGAAVEAMAESAPDVVDDPQAMIDDYLADLDTWTTALVDQGYPIPERDPEAIVESFRSLPEVELDGFFEAFSAEVVEQYRPE